MIVTLMTVGAPRVNDVRARYVRVGALIALVIAAFIPGLAMPELALSQGLTREIAEIEGDASGLAATTIRAEQLRSATYVEERLTDGQLFYNLKDYPRAAIIFTSIVDRYPNSAAYPDALALLAASLFEAGDLYGARTRYREIIEAGGQAGYERHLESALSRLIEIAIKTRNFDGVESYFAKLSQLPPSKVRGAAEYHRGKYLYHQGVEAKHLEPGAAPLTPDEEAAQSVSERAGYSITSAEQLRNAQLAFEAVGSDNDYYARAQYFLGVIFTLEGNFPRAVDTFRQILRLKLGTPEDVEVAELARLALGRLFYETDQLSQAVESYQSVSRSSPHFDESLYEIAWVFIRLGDASRAERALEVLTVAAPDSRLVPEGKVLRGNLLLREGRYKEAEDVFRRVHRDFGPIFESLEATRKRHDVALLAYFQNLVTENFETFDAERFLPAAARRWTEVPEDFERALKLLEDLSEARRLLRETEDLAVRLGGALEGKGSVTVFPDLRQQRERSTALRNRIYKFRRKLVAKSDSEMKRLEREMADLPTSGKGFRKRDKSILERYAALNKELSQLEVELMGLEARATATERFARDTQGDSEAMQGVYQELEVQRAAIKGFRQMLVDLRRQAEVSRMHVGVGDARYERDARLRDEHRDLVRRATAGTRNGQLFDRSVRAEEIVERRDREIDSVLSQRVGSMREVVDEESGKLGGYDSGLSALEADARDVVAGLAHDTFLKVRDHFYSIVLRADVGRIDVSWAIREEHRSRVDLLSRERAREMRVLDEEFRDVMSSGGDS